MGAPKMKIVSALSRPLKWIAPKIALLPAVILAVPASAFATAPTVNVTAYSKTVTGNIGSSTSGVKATVSLLRGNPPTAVATVTSAGTNASGEWTATLPTHAPGDARDILNVSYSGTGAPSGTFAYGGSNGSGPCSPCEPAPTLLGFLSGKVSIESSGDTITIECTNAPGGGTCSKVAVSVDGAPTEATKEEGGQKYSLTFGKAVTPGDSVLVSATVPVTGPPSASSFTLTVPAPLPGATGFSRGPVIAPTCQGDVVSNSFSCIDLAPGEYKVKETGTRIQEVGPVEENGSFGGYVVFVLTALAAKDEVALYYTGPPKGTPLLTPTLLTTLQVGTLRADILQPKNSFEGTGWLLLTTNCQADEWFYGSNNGQVCTAAGHPAEEMTFGGPIESPSGASVGLYDEFSGNLTVVSRSGRSPPRRRKTASRSTTPTRHTRTPKTSGRIRPTRWRCRSHRGRTRPRARTRRARRLPATPTRRKASRSAGCPRASTRRLGR
jgi:hypothetical protein